MTGNTTVGIRNRDKYSPRVQRGLFHHGAICSRRMAIPKKAEIPKRMIFVLREGTQANVLLFV